MGGNYIKNYIFLLLTYVLSFLTLLFISFSRAYPYKDYFEELPKTTHFLIVLSFTLILIIYGLILKYKAFIEKITYKTILVLLTPVLLICFITPSIMSRDLLAYLVPAKNYVQFGIDPYAIKLNENLQNPWVANIKGIFNHKNIYGPIFNLIVLPIGGIQDLGLAIYMYKLLSMSCFLGVIVLIFKSVEKKYALLAVFNPAVLIHFGMEAHNDVFVVFFILLALHYYKKAGPNNYSFISLAIATTFKYYTVLLLPLLAIKNRKLDFKEFLKGSTILLVIMIISGLLFPEYPNSWNYSHLNDFVSRCIYACTPIDNLLNFIFTGPMVMIVRLIIAGLLYVLILKRGVTKELETITNIFLIVAFILLTLVSSWFVAIPIIFATLVGNRKYLLIAYGLTIYSLFHYFGI